MKTTLLSLLAVLALALGSAASAADAKDYQVTGPVLEKTDTMIAVKKGNDRWEIMISAGTTGAAEAKVGDKVTIHYTMSATSVEAKAAKPAKAEKGAKKEAKTEEKKK
jgi:opacity protein-like surface antigen